MKAVIIANPTSGKNAAKRVIPKVKKFFDDNNAELEIYLTKRQKDAIFAAKRFAKSGKYDIIIASGGDGTLNEVINGIMLSGKNRTQKFGIIPLGTENVLAQEMKIPFNPIKAAKIILEGKPLKIDVGKANKRFFFLMAGIGFDAHVATKVQPLIKKILGSAAYSLAAWNELFRFKHPEITVRINGKKTVKGSFVVVGNTKLYGGKLKITPHANLQDGYLDVCTFKGSDVFSFFRYAAGTLTARHIDFEDIHYEKAKKISITSKPKAMYHVDCEVIGRTPVNLKIYPKAINLIVK